MLFAYVKYLIEMGFFSRCFRVRRLLPRFQRVYSAHTRTLTNINGIAWFIENKMKVIKKTKHKDDYYYLCATAINWKRKEHSIQFIKYVIALYETQSVCSRAACRRQTE